MKGLSKFTTEVFLPGKVLPIVNMATVTIIFLKNICFNKKKSAMMESS